MCARTRTCQDLQLALNKHVRSRGGAGRAGGRLRPPQPREMIRVSRSSVHAFFPFQVNENFAIDLIAEQPVGDVESRVVSCDGGGGALGHPKVYINLVP